MKYSQVFKEKKRNSTKCLGLLKSVSYNNDDFGLQFIKCKSVKLYFNVQWRLQEVSPEIVNVISNEPVFFHFSIKTSKCSDNCNNTNDRYAKLCVPDVVKSKNIKVFNLMSRTNDTRHLNSMKRVNVNLDASVCNNKQ